MKQGRGRKATLKNKRDVRRQQERVEGPKLGWRVSKTLRSLKIRMGWR